MNYLIKAPGVGGIYNGMNPVWDGRAHNTGSNDPHY